MNCKLCEAEGRTGPIEYNRDGQDWYCDRGHQQDWTVVPNPKPPPERPAAEFDSLFSHREKS